MSTSPSEVVARLSLKGVERWRQRLPFIRQARIPAMVAAIPRIPKRTFRGSAGAIPGKCRLSERFLPRGLTKLKIYDLRLNVDRGCRKGGGAFSPSRILRICCHSALTFRSFSFILSCSCGGAVRSSFFRLSISRCRR